MCETPERFISLRGKQERHKQKHQRKANQKFDDEYQALCVYKLLRQRSGAEDVR